MATIAQRLIAAGAAPERARAFEQQFTAARSGMKPQEVQDAFDKELAAVSEAQWPYTFRLPKTTDPGFDDYVKLVLGEDVYNSRIGTIENKAYQQYAPSYLNSSKSTNPFDQGLVSAIKAGTPLPTLIQQIRQSALDNPQAYSAFTPEDAIKYTTRVYNEYNKVQSVVGPQIEKAKNEIFKGNKYYEAGLPDPKLKYGETTDFAKGTIDYRTHPGVRRVLTDPNEFQNFQQKYKTPTEIVEKSRQLATQAGDALSRREFKGIEAGQGRIIEDAFEKDVFNAFMKSGASPFFDEAKRRESLKKKTFIPPKGK